MKTTNATTNANTWKFTEGFVTVNGKSFPATYSDASGSGLGVYVFAKLGEVPVRIHVCEGMPEYEACLSIAKAAKQPKARLDGQPEQPKPVAPAKQDKPVEPAKQSAPKAEQPKPVAPAKQDKPAKPAKQAAPKAEQPKPAAPAKQDKPAKPAKQAAPKAEQPKPAEPAKQAAPVDKPWIGSAIEGKGWRIAFDEQAQRTRLIFDEQPTDAQKAAIDAAGFFWSAQLKSWNKKLTCKAHRAALELAETLKAIA